MSTAETQQSTVSGSSTADPFRFGWRYLREPGPDVTDPLGRVPLTEHDVLFPQEEDRIMTNDAHVRQLTYLRNALDVTTGGVSGRKVFCDHRTDFSVEGLEPLGPDLVVVDNLPEWDPMVGTLIIAATGAKPLLVVEVTSENTRKSDIGDKVDFYQALRQGS